jgi:Tol biopolymer transport system component
VTAAAGNGDRRRPTRAWCIALALLLAAAGCQKKGDTESPEPSNGDPVVSRITTIKEGGGRVDWSRGNLIAFDQLGDDLYYDVFTMNPDGSGQTCLTCGKSELPGRHIGNPAWHPSGDFIAIQVQKGNSPSNIVSDYFANPGSGINNDIWVMNRQGTRFWQLTNVPLSEGGVLHPHFSFQGDRLLWSERLSSQGGNIGTWALKVADFRVSDGVPSISNVRQFQPGAQRRFYESHGFTPDGTRIVFTGNLEAGQDESDQDIYTLDLNSGALVNLTNSPTQWDEHAQIMPSGDWIVWMSSMGNGGRNDPGNVKTDYWIMRTDGSAKRQLTSFNLAGNAQYISGGATAADSSWNPDGTRLMAYLILDALTGASRTVVIDFTRADTAQDDGGAGADPRTPESAAAGTPPARDEAATASGIVRLVATRDDARSLTRANALVDALVHDRTLRPLDSLDDPLLAGQSRDRFTQVYAGVTVQGGGVVRQRQGSTPLTVLGTVYRGIVLDVVPAMSRPEAVAALARQAGSSLLVDPVVEDLVVLPLERNRYALAYRLRIISTSAIATAFIDAHTGQFLGSNPLTHGVPDGPDTASTPAPSPSSRPFDMRDRLSDTLRVLQRPDQSDWLASFVAGDSDQTAIRVGEALAAASGYLRARLGTHPAAAGHTPIALVHPQPADEAAPVFAGLPAATADAIVFSDAAVSGAAGRSVGILAAHALGHTLVTSTAGLLYRGESAAVTEAIANLTAWGANGAVMDSTAVVPAVAFAPASAVTGGTAVDRYTAMGLDPLTAGRAIGAIISSALQGEGADTAAQRAALETSLLHALTWLTPPDTTIEMTRAVTLDALRHVAAPRARLRAAWERVGRR